MSNSINFNNGTEKISVPVYESGDGYDTFPIRYPNGDGTYQTKYALLTTNSSKAIDRRIKLTKTSNNTKTVYYFTSASKKIIVFYNWTQEEITGTKDSYGKSPYYSFPYGSRQFSETIKPIVCNSDGTIDRSNTYGIEFYPGYHWDRTAAYSTLTSSNFKLTYDGWKNCLENESYFFQDYFPVFLPVNTTCDEYSVRWDNQHYDYLFSDKIIKEGVSNFLVSVYKLNRIYSQRAYFAGNIYNSAKTNVNVSTNNFPTSFLGATQRYYADTSNDTYCYCDFNFYYGYFDSTGAYHRHSFGVASLQKPRNIGELVHMGGDDRNYYYNGKSLSYTGAGAHLYNNLNNLGNGYSLNSDCATFLNSESVLMFQNVRIGIDKGYSYPETYTGGYNPRTVWLWHENIVYSTKTDANANSKAYGTYTIDNIKNSDVHFGFCSTYGCPFFVIKFNG